MHWSRGPLRGCCSAPGPLSHKDRACTGPGKGIAACTFGLGQSTAGLGASPFAPSGRAAPRNAANSSFRRSSPAKHTEVLLLLCSTPGPRPARAEHALAPEDLLSDCDFSYDFEPEHQGYLILIFHSGVLLISKKMGV